ncbi:hypothetical protein JW906_15055 [bacterium]|nr:hypothetical protein [bacterium]
MKRHVTLLGILYIASNIVGLGAGILIFTILSSAGLLSGDEEVMAILNIIGTVMAWAFIIMTLPGILCGWGLLKMKPWARLFGLILGVINLFNIPFGTALGIYSLWVLLKEETVRLFDDTKPGFQPGSVP